MMLITLNELEEKLDKDSLYIDPKNKTIEIIEECYCLEKNNQIIKAKKNCYSCSGTGIAITHNGRAILNLIEIAKERK